MNKYLKFLIIVVLIEAALFLLASVVNWGDATGVAIWGIGTILIIFFILIYGIAKVVETITKK